MRWKRTKECTAAPGTHTSRLINYRGNTTEEEEEGIRKEKAVDEKNEFEYWQCLINRCVPPCSVNKNAAWNKSLVRGNFKIS